MNKANKRIVKRTYEVDEEMLTLIMMIEGLVFRNPGIYSKKVLKLTHCYLKQLRKIAGLEEKEFNTWDIRDYRYKIEYVFEECKK